MKSYIGIDNGISGGIAIVDEKGRHLYAIPMPVTKHGKRSEIDVRKVKAVLAPLHGDILVTIEEPGGAKSYHAAVSMAASFHALRAVVECLCIPLQRITPAKWQKPMLKAKAGDTKPAALKKVLELWPTANLLGTPRCTIPNTGIIDALLIAEWARTNDK